MIEKLEIQKIEQSTGSEYTIIERVPATSAQMHGKINELVDAVNELQKDREEIKEWIAIVADLRSRVPVVESRISILEEHAHPTATTENSQSAKITQGFKNLQDLYAEQRKWIGKLCRFRDKDYKDDQWDYGLLQAVEKAETAHIWKTGCFKHNLGHWYDYCEPVKPDDDIIYKGGDK
jgi:chromosome segregation ATPase